MPYVKKVISFTEFVLTSASQERHLIASNSSDDIWQIKHSSIWWVEEIYKK